MSDHVIVLSGDDVAAFMASVADLEQEALKALENDSYNLDYTEVAGAILNLSRIASWIDGQVEAQ